ncbi:MAG: xanthine dehydrogenase family protein molybdopterin-binding subunit [Rhodospirillales bacterium]|jgi:carbon-monoxide dehydrogenase large subunit|nr:xanthine dehydrogenase family protein molybdopterin-binding subunit [Rhodospirillales bacterium]
MTDTGIGAAVRRTEDHRFLTGQGTYTDDINRPGQTYAHILRSPHAHATIKGIDTAAAAKADGVVAVFTGQDLADDGVGGMPCGFVPDGGPIKEPPYPALAQGNVRFVGDRVALVIAETLAQARDAADQISVDYEELPCVVVASEALSDGAPQLHGDAPNNLCFEWQIGDKDATDAGFAEAHHVTRIELVNNRKIPNAIEPRASVGEYDQGKDHHTLYTTSQNPHVTRLLMGAFVLQIPEHKLRIVAPDVGGGFGSKIPHYAEEVLVTWAAKKVGRPVKWTAERSESFLGDTHGRDHATEAELALDKDGKFLALRVNTTANLGAYLSTFGPLIPTYLYGTLFAGQYTTPAIHGHVKAVFTNTAPLDAERGAGRPEATYLVERLVTLAAREMDIDQIDLRRRNMVPPDAFPYQTPVALQYDSGDYEAVLDEALKIAKFDGFEARRQDTESRGKRRGIGFSTYIEACGLAPSNVAGAIGARAGLYEAAEVRLHPTGSVTVFTGSHSHGQGHETTFAQIASDELGVPIENVEVVHGDTDRVPFGMGTYGSRSLAVGGSAIKKALDKVVDKAKKIAAHSLEASEADIEFKDGTFTVAGTDKTIAFGDVVLSAYVPHNFPLDKMEPGLDESAFYDPLNFTYPNGCHICEVEIDPETGIVEVVGYTAVDDVGRIINPMIVEGQLHGGIAHGVGQALLEECIYDPSGQLLTGSYMDYAMPRAQNFPDIQTGNKETLCPHNPLGVKGCGEAGAIASPPAVINAVLDALSDLGVTDIAMPATPEKVWRAIQSAQAG